MLNGFPNGSPSGTPEPAPSSDASAKSPLDRLDSWKEIASHLNRDVTTVQRWEKREGMPVHRHLHDKMGSVYASRAELDAWSNSRKLHPPLENRNESENEDGKSISAPSEPGTRTELSAEAPAGPSPGKLAWSLAAIAVAIALVIGAILWLQKTEYFWRSPIADARFQTVTDFDGVAQAAAISRDGHLVAFLSDRDGPTDVWVTQIGSGEFHNLTGGSGLELVNPSIRTLGFSPDGALVTFWVRRQDGSSAGNISIWAVPTLGGQPRPYLDGVAEFDWSPDGSRLVYHTPGPGDPTFVSNGSVGSNASPIFTAPSGLHCHFPLWSRDASFIYFVEGALPDNLDIWRIPATGGATQRITLHGSTVSHPVLLDRQTLLYLSTDSDGSGPFLYSVNVDRRIPHALTSGLDRYTSLAASSDGRRLVATLASPKKTLWRLRLPESLTEISAPVQISLTTSTGSSPRLSRDYLLYVSTTGTRESIWKVANGVASELWTEADARISGGPAISPDGRLIAFSVRERGQSHLYVVQSDGTNPRVLTGSLDLQGDPAWAPDGQSITSAAVVAHSDVNGNVHGSDHKDDHGTPRLFRIPLDGQPPSPLTADYSLNPAWSPDSQFVVYSGPDIGTTFSVKAVTSNATTHALPPLTLTRGARRLAFLPGTPALLFLRGEIQHKNLWLLDLNTGAERQLTNLPPDFDVRNFDISPDGKEVVLERIHEHSEVVLTDLHPN